ncbi:unnamed protein product, partial [Meganyctiphanes norvegica]
SEKSKNPKLDVVALRETETERNIQSTLSSHIYDEPNEELAKAMFAAVKAQGEASVEFPSSEPERTADRTSDKYLSPLALAPGLVPCRPLPQPPLFNPFKPGQIC